MHQEKVVSSRPDREIRKKVITPGDYSLVPYEDSRCRITLSEVSCTNTTGPCEIDTETRIFSADFDGNVLIGDCDGYLDRDFELVLQQMCCGEVCVVSMTYKDETGVEVKSIKCKVELREVTEEQLVAEWGWERLYESAVHHKEQGVELVKKKRVVDGFRRFSKALKMLVAIEPVDPAVISEEAVTNTLDLKVKLYNNLAHCQLHFNEYDAVIQLCEKALKCDPDNIKALYRRSCAYTGLHLYEEAWRDIQSVLCIDPNDKATQLKANSLKPIIEKKNQDYNTVIKKMFG